MVDKDYYAAVSEDNRLVMKGICEAYLSNEGLSRTSMGEYYLAKTRRCACEVVLDMENKRRIRKRDKTAIFFEREFDDLIWTPRKFLERW